MPRQFRFENKTYTLPDGTSDQEALDFLSNQHPAVDMSPHNTGTDTQGEGFFAHATKSLRDLPDAFLSGHILSDPIHAIGQSMQEQINNPSLHHALRAIPGVGMLEDTLAAPARTAMSGDTSGAFGDAADTALQMLLMHRGGARVPEPLQRMQTVEPTGGLPELPSLVKTGAHFSPKTAALMKIYETARKMGIGTTGGESRVFVPPMDLSTSAPPSWTQQPPSGSMGQGMQSGFGVPPVSKYVPDPEDMWAGTSPSPAVGPGPIPPAPPKLPGWQQAGVSDIPPASAGPAQVGIPPAVPPVRTPAPPAPFAPSVEQNLPGGHAVIPEGAPLANLNSPYGFTHPTGSITDLRKQLFATGQELELPGSPAKTRATDQIRQASMDLFGKSVSGLDYDQLYKLNEFLGKNKRLPTPADFSGK